MKKFAILFLVGLSAAFLFSLVVIGSPANAREPLAVTSTPAEFSPTPLPTEFLTPTPTPLPTETPVPTSLPEPTSTPGPSGESTPVPVTLPALGLASGSPPETDPGRPVAGSPVMGSPVTRLLVPEVGLDSPVELVPYDQGAWDISSLGVEVGWLETTSPPGLGGNTVLVGHLNLATGIPGAFALLHQVRPGMEIEVQVGDRVYRYRVVKQMLAKGSDTSIAAESLTPRLTLITCYRPSWDADSQTYLLRRVVVAEPVDPGREE
jgi:LPXTG-site transpeptidase (sortase) family protein